MEFEPMLTPREKSPLLKMSPEEDRTRDAVDSEPKHYQLTLTELFQPPDYHLMKYVILTLICPLSSPQAKRTTNQPTG